MALTFFWRCESATLDGTDDYTAGTDTTGTANASVAINATAALVGSNGIQVTGASDHYRFDSENAVTNPSVGSVGFWVRVTSWAAPSSLITVLGNPTSNSMVLENTGSAGAGNFILSFNATDTLTTTYGALDAGITYFVTFSWNQPASDRRIRIYSSAGSLLHETEDTSTAFTAPANLANTDRMRFGEASGAALAMYMDNIFIGDAYADADAFLTNRSITSYTAYGGGGGGGGVPGHGRGRELSPMGWGLSFGRNFVR